MPLNPLWLLAPARCRLGHFVRALVILCGGAALVLSAGTAMQYTADVTAAVLPLNLAAAVWLRQAARRHRSSGTAGGLASIPFT